jgi:predicted component of type VI protein secretion system
MQTLHVQLLSGPGAGRKASFQASPLSFGRDAANALVLVGEFVSRQHGVIRFENDRWLIENLSANGTRLNGRKLNKPQPLRTGDTVSIGDEPVFSVTLDAPPAQGPASQEKPEDIAARKSRKQARLWVGIGIYMACMLGLMIFFQTNRRPDTGQRVRFPEQWPADRVERELTADLKRHPDEFQAQEHLKRALELTSRLDDSPEVLYLAYRAYREALAYRGLTRFDDPAVESKHRRIREQFLSSIQQLYAQAYNAGASGEYERGADLCARLVKIYSDRTAPLHGHVEDLQLLFRKESQALKGKKKR